MMVMRATAPPWAEHHANTCLAHGNFCFFHASVSSAATAMVKWCRKEMDWPMCSQRKALLVAATVGWGKAIAVSRGVDRTWCSQTGDGEGSVQYAWLEAWDSKPPWYQHRSKPSLAGQPPSSLRRPHTHLLFDVPQGLSRVQPQSSPFTAVG